MDYKDAIEREDALEYLLLSVDDFPLDVPGKISIRIFKDWHWVVLENDEVVFANCILPCITAEDLKRRRKEAARLWECNCN